MLQWGSSAGGRHRGDGPPRLPVFSPRCNCNGVYDHVWTLRCGPRKGLRGRHAFIQVYCEPISYLCRKSGTWCETVGVPFRISGIQLSDGGTKDKVAETMVKGMDATKEPRAWDTVTDFTERRKAAETVANYAGWKPASQVDVTGESNMTGYCVWNNNQTKYTPMSKRKMNKGCSFENISTILFKNVVNSICVDSCCKHNSLDCSTYKAVMATDK